MELNINAKKYAVVVKDLMVTDYNDKEIGTTSFEKGAFVIICPKDKSENSLGVITAVKAYHDNPNLYEKFLDGDDDIQTFLGRPNADGSAEWITEDDQYLVCWSEIAKFTKEVSFEDVKSWC